MVTYSRAPNYYRKAFFKPEVAQVSGVRIVGLCHPQPFIQRPMLFHLGLGDIYRLPSLVPMGFVSAEPGETKPLAVQGYHVQDEILHLAWPLVLIKLPRYQDPSD